MGKAKKSSKRSWKKTQHPDVEEFLDEAREKERHDFSKHTNEALFQIDSTAKQLVEEPEKKSKDGPLIDFDKLKCFELLKPHTNVPDPIIKRNKLRNNTRLQSKHKDEKAPMPTRNSKRRQQEPLIDLWADSAPSDHKDTDETWLTEDALRVNSSIKKKKLSHRPSELPAIEPPHPGFSVNPSFKDHQDLLRLTLDREVELIKKEEKIERSTRIPATAVRRNVADEMEAFDAKEDKSEAEEEDDDDKKPTLMKAKTKKQRRKEKAVKDQERKSNDLKTAKARESDVYLIKQYKKQLDEEDAIRLEKSKAKLAKKELHEKYGQKALSKYDYEEPPLDPLFSDEITGRLVETKTSACNVLLLDRFKSMQKRNIVEVRKKTRQKRTYKLKKYTRPGDKLEWERTGVWKGIKVAAK